MNEETGGQYRMFNISWDSFHDAVLGKAHPAMRPCTTSGAPCTGSSNIVASMP